MRRSVIFRKKKSRARYLSAPRVHLTKRVSIVIEFQVPFVGTKSRRFSSLGLQENPRSAVSSTDQLTSHEIPGNPTGEERRSAHHARILEDPERLLERRDLRLAPLLPLLEGYPDVVAGGAEVRDVLHDFGELLPIGGKLDACVA